MPNRRSDRRRQGHVPLDVDRILHGAHRIESRRGAQWHVQPMSPSNALKVYSCPGCGRDIAAGVAHVVVWRADSILGERAVEDRRHWHRACWQAA